jgi:hypothetical protein
MNAAPNAVISTADLRFVVAADPELELRFEVEELAPQEAGSNRVTAG